VSSNTSSTSKYDPDLLRSDINLAKNRVARLKRELEQIQVEMQYKEQGVKTLNRCLAFFFHHFICWTIHK
jgi:protein KIBRA